MRFAFESKGSEAYKAWLIEVRDGDSYEPRSVANDWRSWKTAWQAARRALVVPEEVVALVAAAQALVLDPTSHVKKLQLEAHAWGPLAAAPQPVDVPEKPSTGAACTSVGTLCTSDESKSVPEAGHASQHTCS